jgi:hydroxypyruvate isomerase
MYWWLFILVIVNQSPLEPGESIHTIKELLGQGDWQATMSMAKAKAKAMAMAMAMAMAGDSTIARLGVQPRSNRKEKQRMDTRTAKQYRKSLTLTKRLFGTEA